MVKEVVTLEFIRGYRVGSLKPRLFVSTHTLLRALMSISSMTNPKVFNVIKDLKIFTTALLPLIRTKDCYKVIVPLNKYISKVISNEPTYATLKSLKIMLTKCSSCRDVVEFFRCVKEVGGKEFNVVSSAKTVKPEHSVKILTSKDEVGIVGDLLRTPLKHEKRVVNVIDRVSNAANPFVVSYVHTYNPLALVIDIPEDVKDEVVGSLKLLGEVGLGGGRSRGFGRFKLCNDLKLCDDDRDYLLTTTKAIDITPNNYYVLLGSLPLHHSLDLMNSILDLHEFLGYLPPAELISQKYFIDLGSIVRFKDGIRVEDLTLKLVSKGGQESISVFTSLVLGA